MAQLERPGASAGLACLPWHPGNQPGDHPATAYGRRHRRCHRPSRPRQASGGDPGAPGWLVRRRPAPLLGPARAARPRAAASAGRIVGRTSGRRAGVFHPARPHRRAARGSRTLFSGFLGSQRTPPDRLDELWPDRSGRFCRTPAGRLHSAASGISIPRQQHPLRPRQRSRGRLASSSPGRTPHGPGAGSGTPCHRHRPGAGEFASRGHLPAKRALRPASVRHPSNIARPHRGRRHRASADAGWPAGPASMPEWLSRFTLCLHLRISAGEHRFPALAVIPAHSARIVHRGHAHPQHDHSPELRRGLSRAA